VTRLLVGAIDVGPVEVASTRAARRKGLLGRDGIQGAMAFPGINAVHTIGMRFPIDVAFCHGASGDDRFEVIRVRTVPPRRIGLPVGRCTLVLEAEAGSFERWGVRAGVQVELLG
jgi:uncharacterized membrane protein (UPF0127 family)